MTNGDALVTGASGAKGVMMLMNDYSNGNDMVVGAKGIKSIKDLKGKKIGVEIGFVSHLLLLNALKDNGLSEADVELVNVPTNETPHMRVDREVYDKEFDQAQHEGKAVPAGLPANPIGFLY